jgi:hypothetical protein
MQVVDDDQSSVVIHPGQEHQVVIIAHRTLTQEEVNRILSGVDLRLYLYGEVVYLDAFNQNRRTTFRLMTPPNTGGGTPIPFFYCEEGNEAT